MCTLLLKYNERMPIRSAVQPDGHLAFSWFPPRGYIQHQVT